MDAEKEKLKGRLERGLRRPILQTVWEKFDGFGGQIERYKEGSLEHEGGEQENFRTLKSLFAEELDYLKRCEREQAETMPKPAPSAEETTLVLEQETPLNTYVRTRSRTISEFLAMLADERADVSALREKVLGARLLSPEEARAIMSSAGSVIEDIRGLGSRLANDYLGWGEEGAVWYLLTGEAPELQPVRISGRARPPQGFVPFQHNVTLSVLPWVPAKEVERIYRNIQKQVLKETSHETSLGILETAQFCWQQFRAKGPMPSWRIWCERWNQTYPDKRFKTWRNFREYYVRGSKKALPIYKFPNPKAPTEEDTQRIRGLDERITAMLDRLIEARGDAPLFE